jgi:hypothetical protein
MKKNNKVKKSTYRISWFRVFVVLSTLLGIGLLAHDFVCYAIIPLFNGVFYQMSYFGFFVEFAAILLVDIGMQLIREWL